LFAIEILPTFFPDSNSAHIRAISLDMKLLPVCRDCNSHFLRFELARLLLRLDHITRFIEYANDSRNVRTRLFASLSLFSPFSVW
jgi:hypothetical protein